MTTEATPKARRGRRGRRVRGERGIAMALTALLILPLLAFTSLAVDLGAWYARAAQIQRAADASSLAGVKYLPSVSSATSEAVAVAKANGFEDGVDGIAVSVAQVGETKLRVTITDTSVSQYFSSLFVKGVDITRSSTAEFISAVPMGSPRNFLGTYEMLSGGDLVEGKPAGGSTPYMGWTNDNENFWSSVSGYCARREHGDRLTPRTDSNGGGSFQGCTPGTNGVIANPEFRDYGYYYGIEFKANLGTSATVQIYDGPDCQFASGYNMSGGDSGADSGSQREYTFTLLSNDSLDPRGATVLATKTLKPSDCASWKEQWKDLFTIANPTKGTYWLQVNPVVPTNKTVAEGQNQFGLRIATGGTFAPCTNDPADAKYDSNINCPNLYAASHLGVYAALNGPANSASTFYLADIGPEQSGKYLDVELWDPAEGAQSIELLDPNNNPVTFTWEVACEDGTYRSENGGSCTTGENPPGPPGYGPVTENKKDVSGTVTTAYRPWGSRNSQDGKYSDRLLRLRFKLPDDITTAYGGATWWKIRYTKGSAAGDRSTWSVTIKGDPLRLVPNF